MSKKNKATFETTQHEVNKQFLAYCKILRVDYNQQIKNLRIWIIILIVMVGGAWMALPSLPDGHWEKQCLKGYEPEQVVWNSITNEDFSLNADREHRTISHVNGLPIVQIIQLEYCEEWSKQLLVKDDE